MAGGPYRPRGLITHRVPLADINEALDQMRTGTALRTCIEI